MNKKRTREVMIENDRRYIYYYNRLMELSLNLFEWHGLPDTCNERFLEWCLCFNGVSCFFKDEVLGFLNLQVAIGGDLNVYRVPKERNAYAVNGYNKILNEKDSVLIFNNRLWTPGILIIEKYARQLYEIDRSLDVNVCNQKFPLIIQGNERQRLTLENMYQQINGNVPAIFTDENLDLSGIKVLQTESPYVADKLETLKHMVWNDALTHLGIENSNTDKAERLITDEVTSNLGAVESERYVKLNARRDACKEINDMYGLDLSVDFRTNIKTIQTPVDINYSQENNDTEEVENNGTILDNSNNSTN